MTTEDYGDWHRDSHGVNTAFAINAQTGPFFPSHHPQEFISYIALVLPWMHRGRWCWGPGWTLSGAPLLAFIFHSFWKWDVRLIMHDASLRGPITIFRCRSLGTIRFGNNLSSFSLSSSDLSQIRVFEISLLCVSNCRARDMRVKPCVSPTPYYVS